MKRKTTDRWLRGMQCGAAWLLVWHGSGSLMAQQVHETLQPMTVVGDRDHWIDLAGSGALVEAVEFRQRGYTNLAQIAARVPGVYVRDEDGFSNFPNISLRGVDGNRSTKVTVMEDGILTSPAPYSAPNAYYAPRAARMAGIEFLKGSSQVRYGPQTTGGVVNFLSTPIPTEDGPSFYNRLTYGSFNTLFFHSWYGDTQQTEAGRVGYVLELVGESSDGFRNIDGSTQDTGFESVEPMLKMFWEPNTALKQRFEFKAGYSNFDANETYTGLTDADLRQNPDRRYAASLYDRFDSDQWRSYLKWVAEPTAALRLESALYYNSFERSWDKLATVNLTAAGSSITNVAEAMMTPAGVALLQGWGLGSAIYQDAFRDHEAYGWQNQANFKFDTGGIEHDLAVGLRLHYDQQDGHNVGTVYQSNLTGGFSVGSVTGPTPITLQEAFATAVFVEDEIELGALTLRPGIRYEWLDLQNTPVVGRSVALDEYLLMGGMGANYDLDDHNALFGGIYRGASPANPSGYAAGAESEESVGLELGVRHRRDGFRAEMVGFMTDFSQLIAPELPGGAGTIPSQNGGAAEVWGVESLIEYDHGQAQGWSIGLPTYVSLTYTNAEFADMEGVLANGAGTFAGARNGAEVPYVPEWRLATGIGVSWEKWRINLDAFYTSSTWGTGFNDIARTGNASAMDGQIDALLLFDLTGHYQLTEQVRLVGGIQNLLDEREIISRAPLGARSNAPRMVFAGIQAQF